MAKVKGLPLPGCNEETEVTVPQDEPHRDATAHIVAPIERREKVFEELKRPVFSLLEKGPLANYCSYMSYDAVDALLKERFISHMTDSVLEEIAEYAE